MPNKKLTIEKLLDNIKKKHGDRYDCSKVIYQGPKEKITLICREHGEFQITVSNIVRTIGCPKCSQIRRVESRSVHGLSHTIIYQTWSNMKIRCYDSKNKSYHNYGGRGIKVCDRWLGEYGFENFLSDMGEKPTKEYTLERIDNEAGYSPDNCRWATRVEQMLNQRMRNTNTTGIRYISYRSNRKLWCVRITINNINYCGGEYNNLEKAKHVLKKLKEKLKI